MRILLRFLTNTDFVYRDDPDLDKMLKDRIRWGDPMAHLVKVIERLAHVFSSVWTVALVFLTFIYLYLLF